jgi:hypothetical protein
MNSFIITDKGVSLLVHSKPYVVSSDHENFGAIMEALRAKDFDAIPGLISKLVAVASRLATVQATNDDVIVDLQGGVVTCQGTELPSTLAKRMIRMVEEGFDIAPLRKFITNLFGNPSNRTIQELYTFLEYGQLPITEDGFFVAYKKINANWTDCHTGSVLNQPVSTMTPAAINLLKALPSTSGKVTTRIDENGETEVSMLRRHVDDRSEQTCSNGLHFCSFEYLQSFGGARVVAVKINPADVVSIPVDYNNTKGRCSKYVVLSEITDETNTLSEKSVFGGESVVWEDEIEYPEDSEDDESGTLVIRLVIEDDDGPDSPKVTDQNVSDYALGYAHGKSRAFQASQAGYYGLGYKHGKGHKPRQFKL